MKKVLSLVLALAMVLGMSTMAFAADLTPDRTGWTHDLQIPSGYTVSAITGWPTQATLNAVPSGNSVYTVTVAAGALTLTRDGNAELEVSALVEAASGVLAKAGAIAIGDFTFSAESASGAWAAETTPVIADLQAAAAGVSGLGTAVENDILNVPTVYTRTNRDAITITFTRGAGTTDPGTPVPPVTGTTIPSGYKIVKVADDWYDYVSWNTRPVSGVEVEPDTTFEGKLDARCFVWENKDGVSVTPSASWTLRTTHLKDIDVRKTNPKNNSGTVASVAIDGTTLEIELVEYFLKTGNTDVTMDLDLTCKGKASGSKFAVDFNIYNDEELVEDGQTYVETDNHIYLKADDSVRNLEMFIGENLYITKSFGKGQKAYARVSLELSAGDEELFHKFAELSDVYTLYTVGVNSANVTARFKDLGDTFFVYDENFKLIGTTADTKLPFSNKYYLTTAKVDLAGADVEDEEPSDESAPDDIDNVEGGGGTAPVNNYNPNTGA